MGVRFDWGLLDGLRHPLPWALSGGLDAANVGEAIRRTGAALVDVSSGVETSPGVKDVDKIAAFLQRVAAS
jgi:phosphoribosylanthranilate isomerase